jgi:hypothetical protein
MDTDTGDQHWEAIKAGVLAGAKNVFQVSAHTFSTWVRRSYCGDQLGQGHVRALYVHENRLFAIRALRQRGNDWLAIANEAFNPGTEAANVVGRVRRVTLSGKQYVLDHSESVFALRDVSAVHAAALPSQLGLFD